MFDFLTARGSVTAIYVIIIFCYLIFTLTILTVNINTPNRAYTAWNYYNPIVSSLTFGVTVLHFNYKRWINYLHLFPQLLFHYRQCPRKCNALASNLKVLVFAWFCVPQSLVLTIGCSCLSCCLTSQSDLCFGSCGISRSHNCSNDFEMYVNKLMFIWNVVNFK